uniref:Uncharacterized protein n=1 Tax=Panagrolaimus sp. PS1159 TaxID=55785 RepID=A0AC35FUS6_9BILA
MKRFEEKVAIVTGSSNGIGRATALAFASEGAKVVIHSRVEDLADLKETENLLISAGATSENFHSVTGYIEDEKTQQQLVNDAVAKFGKIDILINNAGVTKKMHSSAMSIENYDFVMAINLRAPLQLTNLTLPYLKETKGCVINVSSLGAFRAMVIDQLHYSISKAGLDAFMRGCTDEFGKYGVRINNVNFGAIRTGMFNNSNQFEIDKYVNILNKKIPLQRMGTSEEAAKIIVFLASNDASYVSGANWVVDGGMNSHSPSSEK